MLSLVMVLILLGTDQAALLLTTVLIIPADAMAMTLQSWATSSAYPFPFHEVLHAARNITADIDTGLRKMIWVTKDHRSMCRLIQGRTPTSSSSIIIIVSIIIVTKAALVGSLHFRSQMDWNAHQGRAILRDMSTLTVATTTPT